MTKRKPFKKGKGGNHSGKAMKALKEGLSRPERGGGRQ